MKTRKLLTVAATCGMLFGSTALQSCEDEEGNNLLADILNTLLFNGNEYSTNAGDNYFGWFGQDENCDEIQDDINTASLLANEKSGDLPVRVDNTKWLPTIGNQGQYGTCVAWATGYNCRTYLYAKSNGLTTSQLNSSNTFSPADIFMSIGSSDKGANCGGSYFEAAFDKMISRGIATMSAAPYSSLSCNSSPSSSWTSNASNYKIKSYREIKPLTKEALKQYLAQGELIVFGAELGDEFMYADDATVLTKQTSFNATGQHAYHAMVCAGYDDTKGSNGAFRVVNSWGETWGDNGYIWVDENFFVGGKFAYCAFVANDGNSTNTVVVDDDNTVVDDQISSGYDLIASDDFDFFAIDYSEGKQWWQCNYDVYNAGSSDIASSKDWAITLLYYNAYDANDYGILLLDYYSDDLGSKGDMNGSWDKSEAYNFFGFNNNANISGFSWNNIDVKSGQSCAQACGGSKHFEWQFSLPNLSGSYYMVLVADAFDGISETDEENNYLFFGDDNGDPIKFKDGQPTNISYSKSTSIAKAKVCPKQNSANRCQDVRNENNLNAYTSDEIAAMIKAHKELGMLASVPKSLSKSYVHNTVQVRKREVK